MKAADLYPLLGKALSYPTPTLKDDIDQCKAMLESYPETPFSDFGKYIKSEPLGNLEEVYTTTFEVNAVCHLDVGYVLFGEDYKRGELLVHLSRAHNEAQNRWGTELPDHLPNLLNLIPKMKDSEERDELVTKMVHPAVVRMIDSFKKDAKKANVYRFALETLERVFHNDFGEPDMSVSQELEEETEDE
jgi:nitrate reductase assembly molybdenum cofactor insertion protein NarJ